jgi:hypothetical protein
MKNFKFFHGYGNKLTAVWMPETDGRDYYGLNVEEELTRLMSEEIARGVDEEIITRLTRTINGGGNDNVNYLNHWMNIGGQRA